MMPLAWLSPKRKRRRRSGNGAVVGAYAEVLLCVDAIWVLINSDVLVLLVPYFFSILTIISRWVCLLNWNPNITNNSGLLLPLPSETPFSGIYKIFLISLPRYWWWSSPLAGSWRNDGIMAVMLVALFKVQWATTTTSAISTTTVNNVSLNNFGVIVAIVELTSLSSLPLSLS